MIKSRTIKVKSIENEEIAIAKTMTKILITTIKPTNAIIIIIIIIIIIKIKIGNHLKKTATLK